LENVDSVKPNLFIDVCLVSPVFGWKCFQVLRESFGGRRRLAFSWSNVLAAAPSEGVVRQCGAAGGEPPCFCARTSLPSAVPTVMPFPTLLAQHERLPLVGVL